MDYSLHLQVDLSDMVTGVKTKRKGLKTAIFSAAVNCNVIEE
jgi:hypothetical protein